MTEDYSPLALASIRKNRGISLEEIAESTKISMRSLVAIEQGEFRKLPGGIYNTNYIRQYARAIEFDEVALLAIYYRATGDPPGAQQTGPRGDNGIFGPYNPASNAA
jgi:cytoskeletal protein RodZ